MEEEYCDELAEEREINDSVLGEEEPEEDEVLGGGEGKLGVDVADGHLVAPAKLVSTSKEVRLKTFSRLLQDCSALIRISTEADAALLPP